MTPPNIIFLFSDQQRWDTCGCYGQQLPITPNLDQMASEGVKFEYTFTCQPVCGPARACLQTGRYATEMNCFRNGIALPLDMDTIAKQFSQHGYEVGYIGKWHLASNGGSSKIPIGEKFDCAVKPVPLERRGGYKDFWVASDVLEFTSHSYDGHMFNANGEKVILNGYRVDAVTDIALNYLQTRTREKPFFVFISYIEPHHQNDHGQYEGPIGSKEKFANFAVPGDLINTGGDWRKSMPDYLGCCNSLDANLGRIRARLKELGLEKNTLIFYTSDHGSHFKTRNLEYKRACHDACIRVPLIAYGPGFDGGKTVSELISLIDLPPTLLYAAGIEVPSYMRGHPVQPLLQGKTKNWPEFVFLQISESQVGRAIRTKRWKYSVKDPFALGLREGSSKCYVEDYLYDLETDPHERHNLVRDPAFADIRRELSQKLISKMIEIGEKKPTILPWIPRWKRLLVKFRYLRDLA